jgi:hypothetical protein
MEGEVAPARLTGIAIGERGHPQLHPFLLGFTIGDRQAGEDFSPL